MKNTYDRMFRGTVKGSERDQELRRNKPEKTDGKADDRGQMHVNRLYYEPMCTNASKYHDGFTSE